MYSQGTYKYWTDEFSIQNVIQYVKKVTEVTGTTPVFAGAIWDNKKDNILSKVKAAIPNCIDLTGQTDIEEVFGLIKGSEMMVGYPSGLTIMSTVFKKKTLIIWNDYYNRDFATNGCPTDVKGETYFIEKHEWSFPEDVSRYYSKHC